MGRAHIRLQAPFIVCSIIEPSLAPLCCQCVSNSAVSSLSKSSSANVFHTTLGREEAIRRGVLGGPAGGGFAELIGAPEDWDLEVVARVSLLPVPAWLSSSARGINKLVGNSKDDCAQ